MHPNIFYKIYIINKECFWIQKSINFNYFSNKKLIKNIYKMACGLSLASPLAAAPIALNTWNAAPALAAAPAWTAPLATPAIAAPLALNHYNAAPLAIAAAPLAAPLALNHYNAAPLSLGCGAAGLW